jgi:hypothetical protein
MTQSARIPRGAALGALALLLVFALAFLGSRGLYSPDEGRYTGVALEMLRLGDWLHPHLHPEQPHYTKPPLTYWAIASSVGVLGENEWAARLPIALRVRRDGAARRRDGADPRAAQAVAARGGLRERAAAVHRRERRDDRHRARRDDRALRARVPRGARGRRRRLARAARARRGARVPRERTAGSVAAARAARLRGDDARTSRGRRAT